MGIVILAAFASAGILSGMLDTITDLIGVYGYPAVFAAAFLEVIFPPIPSEVIFPLVGYTVQNRGLGLENAISMATVGALGSTAGAVLIYFISGKVGRAAIARFGKRVRVLSCHLHSYCNINRRHWFLVQHAQKSFCQAMTTTLLS